MEYLGTRFTVTIGGVRLRVAIVLDETPDLPSAAAARRPAEPARAALPHHLRARR